jgi:hypothetical protein
MTKLRLGLLMHVADADILLFLTVHSKTIHLLNGEPFYRYFIIDVYFLYCYHLCLVFCEILMFFFFAKYLCSIPDAKTCWSSQ